MKAENLRHWRKFRRAAAKFHGCRGAFSGQVARTQTLRRLRVPNPRFVRVGPLTLLFPLVLRSPAPFNPPPRPFNPHFLPFTAKHLTFP
jgi:hypothetical protein